jgi:hypothetical protein
VWRRYASTDPYVFMAWYLVKHKGNFISTFYFSCLQQLEIANITTRDMSVGDMTEDGS